MTITPFMSLKLRRKKDTLLARQRARRVASLLSFDCQEQACIAAGAFVIACQALTTHGTARLVFQIEQQQLHIFAEAEATATPTGSPRLAGLFAEAEAKAQQYRLTKVLPPQATPAEKIELGWLVSKVEEVAPDGLFAEIVKQNQEMLALLHELRLCRGAASPKEEKSVSPHAA